MSRLPKNDAHERPALKAPSDPGMSGTSAEDRALTTLAVLHSAFIIHHSSFLLLLLLCALMVSCASERAVSRGPYVGPYRAEKAETVGQAAPPAAAPSQAPGEEKEDEPKRTLAKGPLNLTVMDAILLAVENNRSLRVQRLDPAIQKTFEAQERAAFDPVLGAEVSASRVRQERLARTGSGIESSVAKTIVGQATLSAFLPTGTTVGVQAGTTLVDSNLYSDVLYSSRVGMSVTQSLLRGFGTDVNLASLRQAKLSTKISEYELRAFAETLVADVETSYWDLALAQRQIEIFEQSLALAEKQRNETKDRIDVGKAPPTELPAADAEVALRRERLIDARANLSVARLRLLQLINPPGREFWECEVKLSYQPVLPELPLEDVDQHVGVALRMRPDLNQALLDHQIGKLEVVKTKNGLLPKLDFFIRMGKTGYANTFLESVPRIAKNNYDIQAGVSFEYPFANRDANAQYTRARLTVAQAREAIENLRQLVQMDVRTAHIDVYRYREQIAATKATRTLQEEKLRAEEAKFAVGKSTSLLVAQAQRDVLQSQIAEIEALANYIKTLVTLYQVEGSLLERRRIQAPGRRPVDAAIPGIDREPGPKE